MSISAEIDMTDDTKSRILSAAGPIFAEKGFAKATVREICALADVNVASIKYYFGDKQGLYLQTVLFARQIRSERYPAGVADGSTDPETRLYEFVSSLLRRLMALHDSPWQVQLLVRELMKPTEACRTIVRDYFQPAFNRLLLEVDQLAQRPLSDAERLKIGFSIIGQCLHYRFGSEVVSLMVPEEIKQEFNVEQLAAHITQFTMSALRNDRALNSIPETFDSGKQQP